MEEVTTKPGMNDTGINVRIIILWQFGFIATIPIIYTADARKWDQLMCETRSGSPPPPYFYGFVNIEEGTDVARTTSSLKYLMGTT